MLRDRDYTDSVSRESRLWTAFAKALAFVVVPVLRLLCRVFPPLRRAVNDTAGGRTGAAFRTRDRGDHRGAFLTAMEGVGKCRFATERGELIADLNWWMFLDLAATEAEHLGDSERAQVAQVLEEAPAPGGMFAAKSLCRVSVWRWKSGDRDGAIRLARQPCSRMPRGSTRTSCSAGSASCPGDSTRFPTSARLFAWTRPAVSPSARTRTSLPRRG